MFNFFKKKKKTYKSVTSSVQFLQAGITSISQQTLDLYVEALRIVG